MKNKEVPMDNLLLAGMVIAAYQSEASKLATEPLDPTEDAAERKIEAIKMAAVIDHLISILGVFALLGEDRDHAMLRIANDCTFDSAKSLLKDAKIVGEEVLLIIALQLLQFVEEEKNRGNVTSRSKSSESLVQDFLNHPTSQKKKKNK